MGRLVQQSPAAGAHRQHPAGRSRGTLLRHARNAGHGSVTQTKWPPANPGRFTGYVEGIIIYAQARRAEVAHFAVSTSMQGTGLADVLLAFLKEGLREHHHIETIRFRVIRPRPGHPHFFTRIGASEREGGEWELAIGGDG
ncbi:MAG: GNAT family N-acetyltransferase [Devosia sp.]|nr:GNAT family N-acetyltransferase [Devosia sp.]